MSWISDLSISEEFGDVLGQMEKSGADWKSLSESQKEEILKEFSSPSILKKDFLDFERLAKNFIKDKPDILFVSEYIVEGEFIGSLVVWEKYKDSTHYEIFKKNLFQSEASFERVVFLDKRNLENERDEYRSYIQETLGFNDLDFDNIFIILDDRTKQDRIYEYKIRAARVPKKAEEVDYDLIFEGKGLLSETMLDSVVPISLFQFSLSKLGSEKLSWTVSLLNEGVRLFGKDVLNKALTESIAQEDGSIRIFHAKDPEKIIEAIKDSISLFGSEDTFSHILDILSGVPADIKTYFLGSIDKSRDVFSYDTFNNIIKDRFAKDAYLSNFSSEEDIVLSTGLSTGLSAGPSTGISGIEVDVSGIGESVKAATPDSVFGPQKKGKDSLSSLVGLSEIFNFLKDFVIFLSETNGQIGTEIDDEAARAARESASLEAAFKALAGEEG